MFQPNEIVVCVNCKPNYASNDGNTTKLTLEKKYRVESVKYRGNYSLIYILNDYDILGHYYDYRFIELSEYRKQKIQKICSRLVTR